MSSITGLPSNAPPQDPILRTLLEAGLVVVGDEVALSAWESVLSRLDTS